jgi:steroid 5-alpha reductase family enzyme
MAGKADFAPVVLSYVLCIAAAALVLWLLPPAPPWDAFAADVAATLVIFGFSRAYRNSSFYDPYWSVIPPLLAGWWMWCHPAMAHSARALMMSALVWLWALRLTANWSRHWGGLHHEDWRYPLVRARAGKAALLADLGGIHLFPTVQVFLGCLPLYVVMSRADSPLGALDALAGVITLGAIVIETVADLQLRAFIARNNQPGSFISSGLWAWSRHPNYFGELGFWWGLMLFGLAAAPAQWLWIVPGALAMSLMFVFASIPLMDQRSLERRPAYAEHMRKVSALLPLPPRS